MMTTVAEIVAAASRLSRAQLRELRREVDRLQKNAEAIVLHPMGVTCRLTRLSDGEFIDLLRRSLAVEEDYGFLLQLHFAQRRTGEELNFAEVYLALQALTGDSGRHFDDWKGSFSFPFALSVHKEEQEWPYLLEVRNHRDSLYFHVRRVVESDDPRLQDHLIRPPFEDEFSRDEINALTAYFQGYLSGFWETIRDRPHGPFVRAVPSNLILLGHCDGHTFEEEYDSEEAYEAARRRYEEAVRREQSSGPEADSPMICPAEGGPEGTPSRAD